MHKSILDAIREGSWDYEPDELPSHDYDATSALPGSAEKLQVLAGRAERGLPLWHNQDCCDYEAHAEALTALPLKDQNRGHAPVGLPR